MRVDERKGSAQRTEGNVWLEGILKTVAESGGRGVRHGADRGQRYVARAIAGRADAKAGRVMDW